MRRLVCPLLVALVAMSCRGGETLPAKSAPSESESVVSTPTPTASSSKSVAVVPTDLLLPSMPTGAAASNVPLPPPSERPPCAKDDDCWSATCCPATAAEHCVHHSLAQKCAIVDVKCPKSDAHYDCVCVAGQCAGHLHP